ncbi:Protein of unknown function DUF1664 protein [Actinidia chinensis var. chinensis]|uniref:Uncharacterized protein n=1 Tax=Actinidia chinensis var. chinensis TaxID=1590841 RepID=A0A2R6PBJ8_ACTCC|nr:Protein of unknown function DUF1664 protein [Actinidia chinensis var. chinensis]
MARSRHGDVIGNLAMQVTFWPLMCLGIAADRCPSTKLRRGDACLSSDRANVLVVSRPSPCAETPSSLLYSDSLTMVSGLARPELVLVYFIPLRDVCSTPSILVPGSIGLCIHVVEDLMYVTKRNMANAVSNLTKHLEHVPEALALHQTFFSLTLDDMGIEDSYARFHRCEELDFVESILTDISVMQKQREFMRVAYFLFAMPSNFDYVRAGSRLSTRGSNCSPSSFGRGGDSSGRALGSGNGRGGGHALDYSVSYYSSGGGYSRGPWKCTYYH